jgi:hypothetical protein
MTCGPAKTISLHRLHIDGQAFLAGACPSAPNLHATPPFAERFSAYPRFCLIRHGTEVWVGCHMGQWVSDAVLPCYMNVYIVFWVVTGYGKWVVAMKGLGKRCDLDSAWTLMS